MTDHSSLVSGAAVDAGIAADDRGAGCCFTSAERAVGRAGRFARGAAGVGFLALAGALAPRAVRGRIALWPAALVPTWFGISHMVAAVSGYRGCPELGAIPSVMLGRTVETDCGPWERIDGLLASTGLE